MGGIKKIQKAIDKTIYGDWSIRLPMTINKVRCLSMLLMAKGHDDELDLDQRDIEGLGLILRDIEDDLEGINQELCKE